MTAVHRLSHLDRLEAESIHILREVAAEFRNPVLLYSVGKDSSVLLHLLLKAFAPARPPIPLLHVDTRWKFREMIAFRDRRAAETGVDLRVHINPDGVARDIGPITHGATVHTDLMKTQGLKQALAHYRFDAAIGGARRDEEKSRAKERVFSFRNDKHRWDPKNQRPELWNLYNARKAKSESIRVFPISNWTELDIWQYIEREKLALPPIYYAHEREVVERSGLLVPVTPLTPKREGETSAIRSVRFRTVGDISCACPVASTAANAAEIIAETAAATVSERSATRMDDRASEAAMEERKKAGYF